MRRLERAFRAWLARRFDAQLLATFGGIQSCPWCRQCAQHGTGWRFDPWPFEPLFDMLTCGVCRGTSLWMWGMGMHFIASLDAPTPAWPDNISVDIEALRQRHERSGHDDHA